MKTYVGKLTAIVCLFVAALMLASCAGSNYEKARTLYLGGEYAEAREMFIELEDYEDSAELVRACDYKLACGMMDAGDFDGAWELFSTLNGYEDSAARLAACAVERARLMLESGDPVGAAELARTAADAEGAANIIRSAAYEWLKAYVFAEGTDKGDGLACLILNNVEYSFIDLLAGESTLTFWYNTKSIFDATASGEVWGDITAILYNENGLVDIGFTLYLSPQTKNPYLYRATQAGESGATLDAAAFTGGADGFEYSLFRISEATGFNASTSPSEEYRLTDAGAICFIIDTIQGFFDAEGAPFTVQDMGFTSYVPAA